MTRRVSARRSASGVSTGERGPRRSSRSGGARVRPPVSARPASELEPRRRPRQERARATVEAILQAAAELISGEGYAAMSTNAVAARAGVSIGSLYQYFPNKQSILVALLEQHMSGVRPAIERSLEDMANPAIPLSEAMRRMFTRLTDLHRDADPRLQRVLGEEVPHPPHIREQRRHREVEYTARVAAILRDRPDVQVDHPGVSAHVLVQATSALTRWLAHDAPANLDREAYVIAAVRLLTSHLQRSGS
jgi:AcrR family transcriptional regulator